MYIIYLYIKGNNLVMENEESLFCKGKAPNIKRFMEISLLLLLAQEESHGYILAEKLTNFGFSKDELNIARKLSKEKYETKEWNNKR